MRALAAVLVVALVGLPGRARADADLAVRVPTVLHATTVGDAGGATVIVVHGGPGLSDDYLLGLRRLAAGGRRRVVFYEQRGAGRSPRPANGDYSLRAQVADLEAVRLAAGGGSVHILAHSWGTVVALAYAIEHPASVASLVLVGMGAPSDGEDRRAFGTAFAARRGQLQEQGLIGGTRPPPVGDDCMAGFNATLPAHFADPRHPAARRLAGSYRCDVTRATLRAAAGWDFRGQLPGLAAPVLLVIGDADANLAGLDATMALLPRDHAVRGVLRGCGHFPWLECPEPFFAMVERFLDQ